MDSGGQSGISKSRRRLQEMLDAKQFYEAQQTVRMLYHRFVSRKMYDDARDILTHAAEQLFQLKEYAMAGDLAWLLPELLEQSHADKSAENIALLHKFFELFGKDSGRIKFAHLALKWCEDVPGEKQRWQHALARSYWAAKDFSKAQDSFLASGSEEHVLRDFGHMLTDWSQTGYESELGLFIARPILKLALVADARVAQRVFDEYLRVHPQLSGQAPPYEDALLNFVRFLLQTLQRDARPLFELLQGRYAAALGQDPELHKYLSKIGERYFHIQPAPNMQSMLGSLMRGFMGPQAH